MDTNPKKINGSGSIRVESAAPLALESIILCIALEDHEIMIPMPAASALGIARDLIDKTLEHTAEFSQSMVAALRNRKAGGS